MVTYNVGLCRMANGSLDAPYEGASIEAANIAEALQKAKKWAASVEVADNSWLQIYFLFATRSTGALAQQRHALWQSNLQTQNLSA